jgi:hypothetical protein
MKFRPSYYAQQQLTSYAPSPGYPGFYGADEAAAAEEKDADTILAQLNKWCDQKYETSAGKRLACRGAVWTASKLGASALQRAAEEWFGKKVTTADTGSSAPSVPMNLTASEKALLDQCKKKPIFEQPSCLAQTYKKIMSDRESAKKSGLGAGSSTVWWVLGTLAAAGAVGGIWYATKRRRS